MVYIRFLWQGDQKIYGHMLGVYLVLANPTFRPSTHQTADGYCATHTHMPTGTPHIIVLNKTVVGLKEILIFPKRTPLLCCPNCSFHSKNKIAWRLLKRKIAWRLLVKIS
jgi:hypothetical protein